MGVSELLENVGVGGRRPALLGPLQDRKTELLVQDLGELWRRPDVELFPGVTVDLVLERRHPVAQPFGHLLEVLDVQGDARGLHPRQDRGQGHLDVAQQRLQARPLDPLLQHRREQPDGRSCAADDGSRVGEEGILVGLPDDVAQHVETQIALAQRR